MTRLEIVETSYSQREDDSRNLIKSQIFTIEYSLTIDRRRRNSPVSQLADTIYNRNEDSLSHAGRG